MRLSFVLALFISAGVLVSAQQKMEKPGITNYTKVDAVVACGGATETSALEGLKTDGFKAVINLRQASEPGANIPENSARAKALGLNYIHIPFNTQAPEAEDRRRFSGGGRQQGQSAGLRPLRIREPRRRGVAGEARAAGRMDGGEGDGRSQAHWPAQRAARAVRGEVHRGAQEVRCQVRVQVPGCRAVPLSSVPGDSHRDVEAQDFLLVLDAT